MDEISKRQSFEVTSVESISPVFTGILALDMIIGGGL
jgi:hypothetical protein